MPRQARLLVPGGLYHVLARGIERRAIFLDPPDYQEFVDRLEDSLKKSACRCLARRRYFEGRSSFETIWTDKNL